MSIKKDYISIIIPVYNEENNIGKLIDNLEKFTGDFEVIFSDGGCKDKTCQIIDERIKDKPNYKRIKSEKGRANQMNNGAKASIGDTLFFLHCDSQVESDILEKIEAAVNRGVKFGCAKLRFDSRGILMKICGFMSNFRVKHRKIAFGDQGIFIDRNVFFENGGYRSIPLMEDYQLSIDMKEKYPVEQIDSYITTSGIRFEKNGKLNTMYRMQVLQKMYRDGEDIDKIASMYK